MLGYDPEAIYQDADIEMYELAEAGDNLAYRQKMCDGDARYRSERLAGVALWLDRPCYDHWDCVLAVMVGDDVRHHVDVDDLEPVEDDDYCGGCGQIGCGHG